MTSSDSKDEERTSTTLSEPALMKAYSNVLRKDFFPSAPYFGFYGRLPTLSTPFTPLLRRYGSYEGSSSTTSSVDSFSSSRVGRYSPPPQLSPFDTPPVRNMGGYANNKSPLLSLLQSDSGISSASSINSGTPMSRRVVRAYKKTYCYICRTHINKNGRRSQGPRRHLLQYHVRRPLFQCPHCSHASFYDKFHVTSHMRRIHQDYTDRLVNRSSEFEEEVERWYERCFGEQRSGTRREEEKLRKNSSSSSSPPPILTPEAPNEENESPKITFTETPVKVPLRKRKIGFMMEDILQPFN